jgi:hypothetical protein
METCASCHTPKRWEWSYCLVCRSAIDCRCCDCETAATLPEDSGAIHERRDAEEPTS